MIRQENETFGMLRSVLGAALLAVLMVAGCAGPPTEPAPAAAPPAAPPATLPAALPAPGEPLPAGLTAFTGTDPTGQIAVALVRATDGSAVAFLCDGEQVWGWFSGTADGTQPTELTGERGSLRFDPTAGTGTADVTGTAVAFRLAPATAGAGLFRDVEGDTRMGWVLTNDGVAQGLADKKGVPVAGENTVVDEQDNLGSGDQPPPQADETDPAKIQLFRKFRCGRIVLKMARLSVNGGGEDGVLDQLEELTDRYRNLNCEEFYRFPGDAVGDGS